VNLELIPAGQGTQRLPQLVGLGKAVEMCISGAPIDSSEAKDLGLVDQIPSSYERTVMVRRILSVSNK